MSYESHGWLVDASRVCRSDYILRCRLSRLCRVPLALPGLCARELRRDFFRGEFYSTTKFRAPL
jgi:hypothetical protein